MSLSAHIQNLEKRHSVLEGKIESEFVRPLPDFVKVTQLKKQKLLVKEELQRLSKGSQAA